MTEEIKLDKEQLVTLVICYACSEQHLPYLYIRGTCYPAYLLSNYVGPTPNSSIVSKSYKQKIYFCEKHFGQFVKEPYVKFKVKEEMEDQIV